MNISIIVLATNPDGNCVSFNSVFSVQQNIKEFDFDHITKPTNTEIQFAIAKMLDEICKKASKNGLKINSHSHFIFE